MPSVFPGVDPHIERSRWSDFHVSLLVQISQALIKQLRPTYSVQIDERIYIEPASVEEAVIRPDVSISKSRRRSPRTTREQRGSLELLEPVECEVPCDEEVKERFLEIHHLKSQEVVTVIEVLSPGNKRRGSAGREAYLKKRQEVFQSRVNLVEIDLLRSGLRLPTVGPLPEGDYFAFVRRGKRGHRVSVYAWPLSRPLPVIPIPLSVGHREVSLELQSTFDAVYDAAGYDYVLDYTAPVQPALKSAEVSWAKKLLKAAVRE